MAEQLDQIIKLLKLDVLDSSPSLKIVKQKTGINPSVLGLALTLFLTICILVSSAAVPVVVAIACYLIPAYFTFAEMQSEKDQQGDIKFLTYWVVFAVLQILAPIVTMLLSPVFYAIARIAFTFASIHPGVNLAGRIYHQILQPQLQVYQSRIDRGIQRAEDVVREGKNQVIDYSADQLKRQ